MFQIVTVKRRQEIFLDAFTARRAKAGITPLAIFVKKLQESLTRMESFEVVTVAQGSDGWYMQLFIVTIRSLLWQIRSEALPLF